MNTTQTFSADSRAAHRARVQLGWWFPSGHDGAHDLDQRLRAARWRVNVFALRFG